VERPLRTPSPFSIACWCPAVQAASQVCVACDTVDASVHMRVTGTRAWRDDSRRKSTHFDTDEGAVPPDAGGCQCSDALLHRHALWYACVGHSDSRAPPFTLCCVPCSVVDLSSGHMAEVLTKLQSGPQIVVSTPGRLVPHLRDGVCLRCGHWHAALESLQ
jgi:hypothetical protein